MQITLKAYQTELVKEDNAYSSTELKDTYTSIRIGSDIRKSNTDANSQVEGVLFLAKTLKEEVLQGTQKQQKKNVKQLKKLFIQFTAIAMIGGMTYGMITADPITASANSLIPIVNNAPTTEITPDGVMEWAYKIALLVRAIGVGLAMSMIAVVGIYMMLTRNTEKGITWNSDIIKGVVQVIVSIPLIWAIFQLSQIVFKNLLYLEAFTPK